MVLLGSEGPWTRCGMTGGFSRRTCGFRRAKNRRVFGAFFVFLSWKRRVAARHGRVVNTSGKVGMRAARAGPVLHVLVQF